jgi:hypothetical protein
MGSCATTISETHEDYEAEPVAISAPPPVPETEVVVSEPETVPDDTDFDMVSVTPEMYAEIKEDIVGFIYELNAIIRSRDYKSWRAYLDDDYYNYISSPEYMQKVSSTGVMRKSGIVLTTADEYFAHVVVPSRYRDRVDDIEITGHNRVKVITVNKGVRLRLYDLEKTKTGWKIVLPFQ